MSNKTDKAKLAKSAEKIRKAEKTSMAIPKSTRPLDDILRDHVTVLRGNIGLKLDDQTPIEESLRILDWTMALSDHVGFMIGDVLNFGNTKWGTKYTAAIKQTGRAKSTLKEYASVAKRIPPDKRHSALSFEHHRVILRIGRDAPTIDNEEVATVLKEIGAQAEQGVAPTVKELRIKVPKLTPRKPRKRISTGTGRKLRAKLIPPYEPTADEESKLADAEDKAEELTQAVKGLYNITAKLTDTEKRHWLALFEPLTEFFDKLNLVTGKL